MRRSKNDQNGVLVLKVLKAAVLKVLKAALEKNIPVLRSNQSFACSFFFFFFFFFLNATIRR